MDGAGWTIRENPRSLAISIVRPRPSRSAIDHCRAGMVPLLTLFGVDFGWRDWADAGLENREAYSAWIDGSLEMSGVR